MTTVYDEIANTYRQEDYVFLDSHQTALKQVCDHTIKGRSNLKVADFGVGHGTFLKDLHLMGNFDQLIGIDHSSRMVDIAASQSPIEGVVSDIDQIDQHLRENSTDLVIAHFVLAYVPLDTVLQQAGRVLAPGGHLSLVNSTDEEGLSTAWVQPLLAHCQKSWNPLLRLVPLFVRRAISNVHAPTEYAVIEAALSRNGFEVLDRQQHRFPYRLETPDDAYSLWIEQGWCVTVVDVPGLSFTVLKKFARYIINRLVFPIAATHVVESLMLRRLEDASSK